ncbi:MULTISPECIES: hypothetical protein [unclassified Bacillus (in: firmicutes)]|uniref:hypothetical protein n=1 Tax=unclassified Bacillus (in: firmicutes) TaxID=185979 RepID=UPI0030F94796
MYRIIIEAKNNLRYSADVDSGGLSKFIDDHNYENNEFIDLQCNRTDWIYHIRRGDITGVSIENIGEESQ